jgi:predicted molibdopterin-dependent oxidoreductase YjgC
MSGGNTHSIDENSLFLIYDPNKCVLCDKCVWGCLKLNVSS